MRWLRIPLVLFVLILPAITPVVAAGPTLTVHSPQEGAVITESDVTVAFTAADFKIVPSTIPVSEAGKRPEANKPGEGHLHFVLDLQPLVVWDRTDPYTFTNVPPGEHQLMVELANNDHSSLSPRVMQMIRFKNSPPMLPITGSGSAGASGMRVELFLLIAIFALACGLSLRRKIA